MKIALHRARQAFDQDEVPVGAVLVYQGRILSEVHNLCRTLNDATAHAEILAIRAALPQLGQPFLENCDLYVTLEPCAHCAGAIALMRMRCVYFGAYDPKGGAVDHGARVFEHSLHKPQAMGGILETESAALLKEFFQKHR
ncbi:nucleoside deaminase [Candidatus Finniella inopinata]